MKDPNDREDWNSLALDRTTLHAAKPLLGETDKTDEFTLELLQLGWRFDDPIDLYVIRPVGPKNPPVILYLYSYPSESRRFQNHAFCQRLTRGGFAAVGFVSALTGQRYHDRPMKEWFVSELQESLVKSVHDVQMILDYLTSRGDLDMDHVGMFGQGSGGTIAILAAAVDPRIKALNLVDPWGDWPDWMAQSKLVPEVERANYLAPQFQRHIAPFDPIQWLPKLASRPIRIQGMADDLVTPVICQKKIEAAASPNSTEIVHYATRPEMIEATADGKVFDWLKSQLQPESKQQTTQPPSESHADVTRKANVGEDR